MARTRRSALAEERWLHVTTKAVGDEALFDGPASCGVLLGLWDEHLVPAGIRVVAFALMPNHTHALVWTPSVDALESPRDCWRLSTL